MNQHLFNGLVITLIVVITFSVYALIIFVLSEKIFKNRLISKIFVSISPFVFILLGFILKIVNALNYYVPVVSVLLIISILIIIIDKVRIIPKINFIYLFYVLIAGYILFYDAIKYESLGFIDSSTSHLQIVKILAGNDSGYQPGYSILLAPVYFFREPTTELNFMGSAIAFAVYVLLSILLSTVSIHVWYSLVVLSLLPIFNEVIKTLIGVTSNSISILALTVVIITNFIYAKKLKRYFFVVWIVVYIATAITTPALTFYLTPPLTIILIVYLLKKSDKIVLFITQLMSIFIGGVLYVVNSIVSRFLINSNVDREPLKHIEGTVELIVTEEQSFFNYLIKNMLTLDPSNLRTFNSTTNIGGYLVLGLIFGTIIYIFNKKEFDRYIFPLILTGIFGISTMMGLLDISYIKGRVGWYYSWSVLLMVSYLAHLIIKRWYKFEKRYALFLVISFNIFLLLVIKPPQHYRYVDEDAYKSLKRIVDESNHEEEIYLNSSFSVETKKDFRLIDDAELREGLNDSKKGRYIVALDFKQERIDPILSRQFDFRKINTIGVEKELEIMLEKKLNRSSGIRNLVEKYRFDMIYDDGKYKIYSKTIQ